MTYSVSRYRPAEAGNWDEFVRQSRNGTFLLERGFMDYHADRFVDHSLLLHDASGRLAALLPANVADGELRSHGGLTYGGFIYGPRGGGADAVAMLDAVRAYMAGNGFPRLLYKTIPSIYHRQPAEDDRYALFMAGARLSRRDLLSVVPRDDRLPYQNRRSRGVKAARKAGVQVGESSDLAGYWPLLDRTLRERHGVSPVHSLAEIELLRSRFPRQIRLFTATHEGAVVAGVIVFESTQVAHAQYICAGDAGRTVSALDALFDHLLAEVFHEKPYFDFGISNEQQGRVLNVGLLEQKEGFGARAITHDYYLVDSKAAP